MEPGKMSWQHFERHLLALIAVALSLVAQPASAQLFGGRSTQATGCATSAVGGDVRDSTITTVCGMPHEQVVELVRLAASPLAGDRAELIARLSALVPASSQLRVEAIARFFQLLGEVPVEETRLADRFVKIAEEHRRLLEEVRSFRVNDPEVQALRQQAAVALEIGDHTRAAAGLNEARLVVSRKRKTLARVLNDQKREEAALAFEQGRVESARLAYEQAARLFAEAAHLLPAEESETRWRYLMEEAQAEETFGDERGNNPALVRAIASYRAALQERTRERVPLDWAMTQNNLGNALATLGARESGTARLEDAAAAYRAALEEYTRERVPLAWAMTQNNLGNALQTLGARESGTARLEEAAAAYRAALEERTREGMPLDWAITQNNLGNALMRLGERESGTARLEEAVVAYRAALEERTRERVPLAWARSFGGQGIVLMLIAERTKDAGMAQRALRQIQEALETARTGGDASLAAFYERRLSDAARLRDALKAR
jgi:tetratricopeptide (TPR) repeat protein